jgi:hypothetical protein
VSARAPRRTGSKTGAPGEEPARDSRDVLFPRGKTVELSGGQKVTVTKWSVKTLVLVSQRLPEKITELMELASTQSAIPAGTVIPVAVEELRFIAAQTLRIEEEQIDEEWAVEDLLDVAAAIFEVCIVPITGKLLGLAGQVTRTRSLIASAPTTPAGPSPSRSSS